MFRKIGLFFEKAQVSKYLVLIVLLGLTFNLIVIGGLVMRNYYENTGIIDNRGMIILSILIGFFLIFISLSAVVIIFSKDKNNHLITIYRAEKLKKTLRILCL